MQLQSNRMKNLPIELIDGDRSKRYPRRKDFQEAGVPFLNSTCIVDGIIDTGLVNFISLEKFNEISKGRLQRGDIILTTRGNGIGKVALFDCEFSSGLINAQLLIIRSNSNVIHQLFLFYFIQSDYFQKQLRAFSSGSAQPQIPIRDIKEIVITYPNFRNQILISSILSMNDNLIENNRQRIRILEKLVIAIFNEWCMQFRFPEHEKMEMIDSKLGEIPKGWEISQLGSIAEEVRRNVDPSTLPPDTPYIGLSNIPRKSIALTEWGYAKDAGSNKLQFKKGEILFGKIRPYFHKVALAPIDGICSGDTIIIMPKKPELFAFVLSIVSSKDFVAYATASSKGTKMPRADWDVLVKYPVIIPELSILRRFNSMIRNTVDLIQTLIFMNRNLRKVRDLLLPRIISGDIDISKFDTSFINSNIYKISKYMNEQSTLVQWLDGDEEDDSWK